MVSHRVLEMEQGAEGYGRGWRTLEEARAAGEALTALGKRWREQRGELAEGPERDAAARVAGLIAERAALLREAPPELASLPMDPLPPLATDASAEEVARRQALVEAREFGTQGLGAPRPEVFHDDTLQALRDNDGALREAFTAFSGLCRERVAKR